MGSRGKERDSELTDQKFGHNLKYIYNYIKENRDKSPTYFFPPAQVLLQHCVRQLLSSFCYSMPSLRRTMSSPSVRSSPAVRSSPYPTSLSSAAANGGPATRPGHGHRRSSGSDTATRRVLADIEWWRVTEGQRDPEAEQDDHDHEQTLQSPAENLLDLWEGLVSPVWPGFLEVISSMLNWFN